MNHQHFKDRICRARLRFERDTAIQQVEWYKSLFETARKELNLRSVEEGQRVARLLGESGCYKRFTDPVLREEGLKRMREMMVWNPPKIEESV
jgi:hypothetical protein